VLHIWNDKLDSGYRIYYTQKKIVVGEEYPVPGPKMTHNLNLTEHLRLLMQRIPKKMELHWRIYQNFQNPNLSSDQKIQNLEKRGEEGGESEFPGSRLAKTNLVHVTSGMRKKQSPRGSCRRRGPRQSPPHCRPIWRALRRTARCRNRCRGDVCGGVFPFRL